MTATITFRVLLLFTCVGALNGCTTTPVYLQHPTTGRIAKCGPYDARPINSFSSAQRERGCIEDFQRQGFERMAEPPR